MRIKYLGGRSRYLVSYNRKPYHFTPENNYILDIQEKEVVNYIFGLPNRAEFEAVMEEVKPQPIIPEPKMEAKKDVIKKVVKSKKKKGGR